MSANMASCDRRGRPRRISRQKFPKRTRILSIPSKPHSFHSVHCAVGSRMNGMIFRSFRKRNSPQKNINTVYSEYSYSGIVPKECAFNLPCMIFTYFERLMTITKQSVFRLTKQVLWSVTCQRKDTKKLLQ